MNIVSVTSTLHYIVGIGLPLGSLPLALYVLFRRELPQAFGIRFYGGGFIERQAGIQGVIAGAFAYILLSASYVLAAYWLGRSMRLGAILSLALLPISMFFALGFMAPIPIVLHPLMAVLALLAWSSLR